MSKVKWLDRRISAPGPYLALVTSNAEYNAALKHVNAKAVDDWIKSPQAHATTHLLDNPDRGLICIVAINAAPERTAIEVAGLLVHEAVHVVQEHFKWIGEYNPAPEQQAYAIQCVAQELLQAYAEKIGERT